MSPKIAAAFVVVGLLTALNLGLLIINISVPSKAANGSLADNPDFARGVKSIVEQCKVNVDLAAIKC
jgi:hypothetical protein